MSGIAKFEKVSPAQFAAGMKNNFENMSDAEISSAYSAIKLPKRATSGSAGYDFYSVLDFELSPGETINIPTGIRVKMEPMWALLIYPRSGLGFKYRLQLNNTVGVIDSDYYYSDNEGHIFIKITNDSRENKTVALKQGDGFAQGIFTRFGMTVDDDTDEIRNGGFGSTSKGGRRDG